MRPLTALPHLFQISLMTIPTRTQRLRTLQTTGQLTLLRTRKECRARKARRGQGEPGCDPKQAMSPCPEVYILFSLFAKISHLTSHGVSHHSFDIILLSKSYLIILICTWVLEHVGAISLQPYPLCNLWSPNPQCQDIDIFKWNTTCKPTGFSTFRCRYARKHPLSCRVFFPKTSFSTSRFLLHRGHPYACYLCSVGYWMLLMVTADGFYWWLSLASYSWSRSNDNHGRLQNELLTAVSWLVVFKLRLVQPVVLQE